MSRRSRELKRQRKEAERLAAKINNGDPVIGDFQTRVSTIIRETGPVDNRLPAHYRDYGGGHMISHYNGNGNNNGYKRIDQPADDGVFRIAGTDITKGECPIAKIPKVYVNNRLWGEWIALASDYPTEWLAYLTGQFVSDDKGPRYEIRKMYFPPQVAHATHVEVDDDFNSYLPNTIGAIHSHVSMNVFFSGEDLTHSNWPVEIVVNAKGEAKVMIRHLLECGKYIKNYSEILTVGDSADERCVKALDKALEAGDELRKQRIDKLAKENGYRTPEPKVEVDSQQGSLYQTKTNHGVVTYDQSSEWHFKINGKPHRWRNKDSRYIEVVKINGQWLDIDSEEIDRLTDPEINGELAAAIINEETGQITVPDPTGHSTDDGHDLVTRPATQDELDRLIEAEVDAASCIDCGGTGKLDANGTVIECVGCGGTGLKPGYSGAQSFEGYTC